MPFIVRVLSSTAKMPIRSNDITKNIKVRIKSKQFTKNDNLESKVYEEIIT